MLNHLAKRFKSVFLIRSLGEDCLLFSLLSLFLAVNPKHSLIIIIGFDDFSPDVSIYVKTFITLIRSHGYRVFCEPEPVKGMGGSLAYGLKLLSVIPAERYILMDSDIIMPPKTYRSLCSSNLAVVAPSISDEVNYASVSPAAIYHDSDFIDPICVSLSPAVIQSIPEDKLDDLAKFPGFPECVVFSRIIQDVLSDLGLSDNITRIPDSVYHVYVSSTHSSREYAYLPSLSYGYLVSSLLAIREYELFLNACSEAGASCTQYMRSLKKTYMTPG